MSGNEERDKPRRPRWMPPLQFVGYGLVGLILVGYFVWLCAEMSGHAISGGGSLAGIFGSAAVGLIAGGIGMRMGRAGREH
jgi:hypothetical protein